MTLKEINYKEKYILFGFNVDMDTSSVASPDDFLVTADGPQAPYSIGILTDFKSPTEFVIDYDIEPAITGGVGESEH